MFTPNYLPYEEITVLENSPLFRSFGFPMEYSISIPLPTLHWDGPGYAYFASPTRRSPNHEKTQYSPAYWWVVDARTALLKLYVPYHLLPFAADNNWEPIDLSGGSYRNDEIEASLVALPELITKAASHFFINQPCDYALRQALYSKIRVVIPEPLKPQYQALVPDFFIWLENKG